MNTNGGKTTGNFRNATLKSLVSSLPEQLITALNSFLKRKRREDQLAKHDSNSSGSVDQTKLSSLGKMLTRYAMLLLAIEAANYTGNRIVNMQNLHMGMRARKLFALLLTFFTATVAQFKLKVDKHACFRICIACLPN